MKRSIILFIVLVFLGMVSCKKTDLTVDQERNSDIRSAGDFINNNYDLSLFAAALTKIGYLDSLNATDKQYTVWAPDNNAFNNLGFKNASDFNTMNVDSLRFAVKNLILTNRYYTADFPSQLDNIYTTAAGGPLWISVVANNPNADAYTVSVSGCEVYASPKRNIALRNGVLHILKSVPKYFDQTLQDRIAADTSLVLFAALMKKTSQWDALKTQSPLTVYAPVNNVFKGYKLTADSISRIDVKRYKPVAFTIYTLGLKAHHLFSNDLNLVGGGNARLYVDGYGVAPAQMINIWTPEGKYAYHSPSYIRMADGDKGKDFLVNNGVLHRIDNVMLYPDSLLIK
ncbi:fasciclin domain-containing protein [Chitinophaga sp. Cy-1792]|uniref:fasciclin domain-containing protein n=1 Tax=Chitinophaga sp. Cy-1792 TaxID=2608339 RepID=UPI00142247F4|nr:fasciclin domain-containing protein [Chitinophaga sp. Cy-1792]NIG57127.1 fasciclin domain-containing protein [Chitinophaga sp. Cy-1792]